MGAHLFLKGIFGRMGFGSGGFSLKRNFRLGGQQKDTRLMPLKWVQPAKGALFLRKEKGGKNKLGKPQKKLPRRFLF